MLVIVLALGIIGIFMVAFLIDISLNLRRVDGNIKKMIAKYEGVHGSSKP